MRGNRLSITILAIALLVGVAWVVHREVTPKQPAVCEICGRGIMKQVEFRIETAHGTLYACCPGCALHHILNHPGEARKELATDFKSGRLIPARSAYYDMGGDVQYCTRHDPSAPARARPGSGNARLRPLPARPGRLRLEGRRRGLSPAARRPRCHF